MNKADMVLKALKNRTVRRLIVRGLKNQQVRRLILHQLKRRAFGR